MKAIAEFEMPECCQDCPCSYETEGCHFNECKLLNEEISDKIFYNEKRKLDNCPLKLKEEFK